MRRVVLVMGLGAVSMMVPAIHALAVDDHHVARAFFYFGLLFLTARLRNSAWGLVSVLAGSGIRYFAPSIPDYFSWDFQVRPFWNEAAVLPRDMICIGAVLPARPGQDSGRCAHGAQFRKFAISLKPAAWLFSG